MATPTKYYATRDFTDSGTEKAFKHGDELTNEPGVGNYAAAGLASTEKPHATTEKPQASNSAAPAA